MVERMNRQSEQQQQRPHVSADVAAERERGRQLKIIDASITLCGHILATHIPLAQMLNGDGQLIQNSKAINNLVLISRGLAERLCAKEFYQ